jgi:RHS repeat-associated protein
MTQTVTDATLDRSYHYDHVGRLQSSFSGTSARAHVGISSTWLGDGPYAAHDYVYDVWGNNTARSGWGGSNPQYSTSFTNNKMNWMVYDASGNLADAGGGWTFTYDATSRQTYSAIGNLQNWYDGDRLRGKKSENGAITYYLRSSVLGGQVVAEITANGVWARGYVYLGGQLLAVQCGGVYWVHQDPLVKSKRVTDSSGTVVSTVELDAWGGETNRSSNEAFQPRKFTTYERDSIASDDAMNRRYNRWWGRFEQPDPYDGSYDLSNPQTFNRYTHFNNDPVNFVDPSGLDPDIDIGTFSAGDIVAEPGTVGTFGFGGEVGIALRPLGRLEPVEPQKPAQTGQTQSNPNCIMNAVSGATGLARPFGNVGADGTIGHDGIHVVSPVGSTVRTLGVLAGTVLGRPHAQGDGLYAVDVLVPGVGIAIYKDLATVNVHSGQRLRAGTTIGTVGEGGDYAGLHFALLRGGRAEDKYYRGLTARSAAGDLSANRQIQASMFINPNGPNSPVNCPGVPVNAAGVNPHP